MVPAPVMSSGADGEGWGSGTLGDVEERRLLGDGAGALPSGRGSESEWGVQRNICSSGAISDGYGSFKSKKADSGVWNNFDLIRNGETRSLN
jgi:hypothetical protein